MAKIWLLIFPQGHGRMHLTLHIFITSFCCLCQGLCQEQPWYFNSCMECWAEHTVMDVEQGWHPHDTDTGVSLLCGLHLSSPEDVWMMKRDCSLFLCPSLPALLCSPAPLRHTEMGFLMGGRCAGNDNHNAKYRLSAHVSSGQDQQRPPKWFRVTWCGSIVYLIKKWPILPHTTCLVLFVAWLPAKAFLNRPCVSYCGGRHLSMDSVSSCRAF